MQEIYFTRHIGASEMRQRLKRTEWVRSNCAIRSDIKNKNGTKCATTYINMRIAPDC